MTAEELMECLKKFKPNQRVILFDEDAIPYMVESVVIDVPNDGAMNHIILRECEE